ncbi:MAG TPA: right-handed parallel beta-helix repeat-containing protein, partial [Thermoanaerobaculia bacterium]
VSIFPVRGAWTCTIAAKSADCTTAQVEPFQSGELTVTLHADATNGGTATLTMTVTAAEPPNENSQPVATADLQLYHLIVVDTVAENGPGSLRAAIEEANSAHAPAKIAFRLTNPVPGEGYFVFTPLAPLPPITAESIVIDGKSQTRFSGDTNLRGPEIAIDGHLAHKGLEIHSPCEAKIEGLALGHFDGNQALWFTKDGACTSIPMYEIERWVKDNYIGTDPTGTVAWPNLRGLRLDFGDGEIRNNVISGNTYSGMWLWETGPRPDEFVIEENLIGTAANGVTPLPNGAAGMLLGPRVTAKVRRNVIANHPGMGVALVPGESFVDIRENSMRNNGGLGIDWGIDGISPVNGPDARRQPNAPVLLASRYDAERDLTFFTVSIQTERLPELDGSIFWLDFYANDGPDGDGEHWLAIANGGSASNGEPFEVWIQGNHRGRWINATQTRVPQVFLRPPDIASEFAHFGEYSTSELSNAILAQ